MNIKKLSADARLALQQVSALVVLSQSLTELEQLEETARGVAAGLSASEATMSALQQKISAEQAELLRLTSANEKLTEELKEKAAEGLAQIDAGLRATKLTITEQEKAAAVAEKELADKYEAQEASFRARANEIDLTIAGKEKQLENINRRLAAIKTKLEY